MADGGRKRKVSVSDDSDDGDFDLEGTMSSLRGNQAKRARAAAPAAAANDEEEEVAARGMTESSDDDGGEVRCRRGGGCV